MMYPTMTNNEDKERLDGIYVVIKPMEERTFALHRFADFESAHGSTVIAIRCRWKNTRKPFPIPRYVRVKTTTVKQDTGSNGSVVGGKGVRQSD